MKCSNCGYENNQGGFCTNCGCPLSTEPAPLTEVEVNRNFALKKIVDIATDKLFFVVCILLSALVGLEVVTDEINIINLLIMIFAWIMFANGRKGVSDPRKVQCISGTVYFIYIINYVASGLILFGAGLVSYGLSAASFNKMEAEAALQKYGYGQYATVLEILFSASWIILVIGIILVAVMLVFNIFGWKNIHAFVKSVHESASNGNPNYKCCKTARNWLIVFAVLNGIAAISTNIMAMLVAAIPVALQIIGAMIINNHFIKPQSSDAPVAPEYSNMN